MSLKRATAEVILRLLSLGNRAARVPGANIKSIFVLRNNDLGDLLVVTPLFQALKETYPQSKVVAGIGSWNYEILSGNPYVDEVVGMNAPWHNKVVKDQSLWKRLSYCWFSEEVKRQRQRRFDIGIDVLGSPFGSLLMLRAKIPFRLGVKGYAGGHSACQCWIEYNPSEHVGRQALRFAELLGATDLPENRPQIYLSEREREEGENHWEFGSRRRRIVIAAGGGFPEKCWPPESFERLGKLILEDPKAGMKISLIGGGRDRGLGDKICCDRAEIRNFCGDLSLRQSFALIAASDIVLTNSSMAMHAAAAFRKPAVVVLGSWFDSAKAHARQWSYPEQIVAGRELAQDSLPEPDEIMVHLRSRFSSHASEHIHQSRSSLE